MKKRTGFLLSGVLIVLIFAANGCVYTRLLKFKKQLQNFERYITIEENNEVLIFLHPLLLPQDIRWLMKDDPTSQSEQGHVLLWKYVFTKKYGEHDEEGAALIVSLFFENGKLQRLGLPQQFSSSLLPSLLRTVGDSEVDKQDRTLSGNWAEGHATGKPLDRQHLEDVFGPPCMIQESDANLRLSYTYRLQSKIPERQDADPVQLVFLFHYNHEKLVKADLIFNEISTSIHFPNTL